MASLTIRAADAALALDEVQRRLGPDAMILSTHRKDGLVEVTATSARSDIASIAQAATASPRSFAGRLLTQLADAPWPTGASVTELPSRVILAGPPGCGRSTLAARLAAEALRCPGAAYPSLIAPRSDSLAAPGRLAAFCRVLGLTPDRPLWASGLPGLLHAPNPDVTQIIDLSDLPSLDPGTLANLAAVSGAEIWLVLPTGLRADRFEALCAAHSGIARLTVLTQTDLCPPDATEFDIAEHYALPVALLSGGTGLLDALIPPPLPSSLMQETSHVATHVS